MYQPISVSQLQRGLPDLGSKASTLPITATINSALPSGAETTSGVFHDSRILPARQTSFPVALFKAIRDWLSTLALTIKRSSTRIGEAAEPQPLRPSPTSACQSSLPP